MSELLGKQTLILNNDYKPLSYYPLSTNSIKKVLKSVLMNRVNILDEYPETIKVGGSTIHLPKVVVLKKYIDTRRTPKFCRNNVFLRDGFTCQYCGKHFSPECLTYDHVIPRVLGGKTEWCNIVTACRACNTKKGCKTLEESKMKLIHEPTIPTNKMLLNALKQVNKEYGQYNDKIKQLEIWNDWLGNL